MRKRIDLVEGNKVKRSHRVLYQTDEFRIIYTYEKNKISSASFRIK